MNDTIGSAAIEAMSANAVDARFEDLDRVTIETAKNRIIDILGCGIGGVNAPGNAALVDLVKKWGGKGEATIWVHGVKAPAHNVAMVNSIMARSYDFEVMTVVIEGKSIPAHISATNVPIALATSEARRLGGKDMITALVIGDDMTSRVLAAQDWNFDIGSDGIGTLNVFGAAAIAGRLLGLNKRQMRNAFGIALDQASGSIQSIWDGAATFKLPQGLAARSGIFSAELAKAGWTGIRDPLLSRFGFFKIYCQGCKDPGILTRDLGKKYHAEAYFKPYPCGFPNHVAIKSALALVNKHDIKAADIEEVKLGLIPSYLENYYAKPFNIRNFPQADAIFSFYFTVATALHRKSVKIEHFTENSIRDPEVNALIGKIELAELRGHRQGCEIRVKMKDGREFSEFVDPDIEWKTKPTPREEIVAKFWGQVEFSQTVTKENAEKLLSLVEKLEEVDDVSNIVRLLRNRT